MQTHTHWKTEIDDLRSGVHAVLTSVPTADISPRAAARCLSGVISLIVQRFGVDAMQRACADLVRCPAAWETSFGNMPRGTDGAVAEPVKLLAMVARGILPIAGAASMRDALSFWALESDPSMWQRLAAGAAL